MKNGVQVEETVGFGQKELVYTCRVDVYVGTNSKFQGIQYFLAQPTESNESKRHMSII